MWRFYFEVQSSYDEATNENFLAIKTGRRTAAL